MKSILKYIWSANSVDGREVMEVLSKKSIFHLLSFSDLSGPAQFVRCVGIYEEGEYGAHTEHLVTHATKAAGFLAVGCKEEDLTAEAINEILTGSGLLLLFTLDAVESKEWKVKLYQHVLARWVEI